MDILQNQELQVMVINELFSMWVYLVFQDFQINL